MGALHALQVIRTDTAGLAAWARRERVAVVGALPHTHVDYRAMPSDRPVVIFIGSERQGLTPEQQALCDVRVRIPMQAGDSLNLAVAGSLLLYEVWRQQHPLAGAVR